MTVADVVEKRRKYWSELEGLCEQSERQRGLRSAERISQFAALYRGACADLALSEAYQLPPSTRAYLHRLVARAHNQLYRGRGFQTQRWARVLFYEAPQQIYADACVRFCTMLFFGLFLLSMWLAFAEKKFPNLAERIVGSETLQSTEEMYSEPLDADTGHYIRMSSFYIRHNTGIGLECFALGILILPSLYTLSFNAISLGTIFGYMARDSVEAGDNFLQFVTAHGPFELTAIALSAAAGLRIGLGWINTARYRRMDGLRLAAVRAVPIISASAALFFLAALTEGILSPSRIPYLFKALWAVGSSGLMMFYFVVLGVPREAPNATG